MSKLIVLSVSRIAVLVLTSSAWAADSPAIDADRAWHLARIYYMRYFGGCGGVGTVVFHRRSWEAPVHYGYSGELRGNILVDHYTGSVSYRGYPTLSAKNLDEWLASLTQRRNAP